MGTMGKQEDFHTKYLRLSIIFIMVVSMEVNAYGGNNHGGGKFISRGHMVMVTSLLEDQLELHSPYNYYEGYHVRHYHYEPSYDREVHGENMHGNHEYNDHYSYRGYGCGRSTQTLGTTSRSLSYNNLKLPLLCGTFGPYDYVEWEQEVEYLFYFYGVREEEKFQLVLKSFSYLVNNWWDCNCKYRRKMGLKPIKTCSLMNISLEHPCTWKSMLGRNHTKNSEDQEEIVGNVLFQCHENSSTALFLTLLFYLMKFLMRSVLYAKFHEKFIGIVVISLSFYETLMKNFVGVVPFNQLFSLLSGQIKFLKHELSNVIDSLNSMFRNDHGFKFYHMYFKEFLLLKYFETKVEVGFEMFKGILGHFLKANVRNESFEQSWKAFTDKHLSHHVPFKEWCRKLFISVVSCWNSSWAIFFNIIFDGTLFYHLPLKQFLVKKVLKEECLEF
ncbi:hypothetical protein M9H77_07914 [Catharanthus roseus]|uniref:Uncharacterized protein n=1 Tax=Catharanthus roseus TaxID=4058 RepID=A0ACC0BWK4_CATRO|nr:hypothetical protein M9H77_07914 [Catharanthus roseus]